MKKTIILVGMALILLLGVFVGLNLWAGDSFAKALKGGTILLSTMVILMAIVVFLVMALISLDSHKNPKSKVVINPKSKVVITVMGGVVSVDELPKDIEVEVRDYDMDGVDEEHIEQDGNGNSVVITQHGHY